MEQAFKEIVDDLLVAYKVSYIGTRANREIKNEPFVNSINEFIAVPKTNSYFRLSDCKTKRDVQKKMLHWLSRDCAKANIGPVATQLNREGFNNFMGTAFNDEEFLLIYEKLGNGINEPLTEDFIDSEFDIDILKGGNNIE